MTTSAVRESAQAGAAGGTTPYLRRHRPTASRAPTQRLPADLRASLADTHGSDFSDVRVHTDREAGESALALGAAAYTVGRDIVFAPGAYAPQRPEGQRLIAHEAFHVMQQAGQHGAPPAEGWGVAAPDSASERQADQAAEAHMSGRRAPRPAPSPARTLNRSLLGAGIGGLLGGVAGGLIGGMLFGPVGAVVGGLIGLVGGAILGDLASRRSRSLSSDEVSYLQEVYRDSVDYAQVTITRGSALSAGAARTTGNTINLQDEHFDGDTMNLSAAGQLVLAHEMGHVWQYQNGGLAYIPSSLIPQIVAGLSGESRNAAYDWRAAVANRIDWADWNAEQQAECISDYNEALRRVRADNYGENAEQRLADIHTIVLAEPYIALVQARVGAPGSARRRADGAPSPQGGTP